ncbi:MAG: hypothetical protein QOF31_5189, partial [Mycobacterium sp.]|nr:hypothetical protein [Mycobacterium sp.]
VTLLTEIALSMAAGSSVISSIAGEPRAGDSLGERRAAAAEAARRLVTY